MKKLKLNIQLFSVSQDDSSVAETDEVYFEFEDLPSTKTALDCENINEMQKRIKRQMNANKQAISDLNTDMENLSTDIENLTPKTEYTESDTAPYCCNYINENFSKNLITNGPAIKSGRKIDGYTEYVKRISAPVQAGTNRTVSTGLTNGTHEIVNYHGIITNFNGTSIKVRDGFYNGGGNYFSLHSQGAQTFYVILGSDTSWAANCNLYIDIYYIDLTEVVE